MEKPILFLMFDMGTKTIWSPPVKLSYNNKNIPQTCVVYSRNYKGETFSFLKKIDSSRNFVTFFTSIIEKVGLYTNITKKNIRYGKFLQNARYTKLVEST